MRFQASILPFVPHSVWAAVFVAAVASGASPTTTTLTSTGSNPYSLTATVTTNGLPRITGSVTFADQTNGYTLNSSSLSAPVMVQSFLPPVLVQEGQGCTGDASNYSCPGGGYVLAGDFNGDGKPDAAIVNLSNTTVTVMIGNGDSTFGKHVSSPIGVPQPQLVTGDFNNDGKLDLLCVNPDTWTISVLVGNGDGSFTRQASTPTGSPVATTQVAIGDLDRDGKLDVALLPYSTDDPLRVYLGLGDGTFLPPAPFSVTAGARYQSFGDFNGDGKPDLAYIALNVFGTSGMYIALGKGDGTFYPASWYQLIDDSDPDLIRTLKPIAKIQGDFNGDGKPDQLIYTTSRLLMMLGNGDGKFGPVLLGAQSQISTPSALLPLDFNGDGKLDVLEINSNGTTWAFFPGNGDGTLQNGSSYIGVIGAGAATVDLNGDGLPDVVGSTIDAPNLFAAVTMNSLVQTATATLQNTSIIGGGPHNVGATYTGDPAHLNSAASLSLAAARVATSLQFASSANSIPFRGTVNLSATVSPRSAQNLAAGGLVTFTLSGSAAPLGTASLNAQGVATLPNVTLPLLGANSITAQYAGDTNFANAASAPLSVTVSPTGAAPANGSSCNGAYTGTFNGSITVLPGQYCEFSGGTVRGNLSSIGGVVVLLNTVVTGNVQILGPAALRGPAQHAICGSTVQGNVEVAGAFDPVTIGGTTAACGASRIGGNLQLQLNARQASLQVTNTAVGGNLEAQLNGGPLALSGGTVSGNLSVQNNIGGVTVTGNRVSRNMDVQNNAPVTVVTANQVTGNLQCSSNTGISGSGNTAKQKQGQCAAF